ncbi:MAG: chromate transporter, partial [Alphaproteobacteria bacterium]|nr:chromate transporter [Alphaproteobacteria bacterium]
MRTPPAAASFADALGVWIRIGLLSFGGPAAQIALMHRMIVEERQWLAERQFLNALNFCMLLPGPEAMQLATYAGWRLHGVAGGLAAGLAFILPGAAVVLALSMIYAAFGNVPLVEAIFLGVKAAVLVIVIEALLRISKRALKGAEAWALAALSFVGIFFLALPYPLIVLAAALYGFARPGAETDTALAPAAFEGSTSQTAATIALWLAIWIIPLLALGWVLGFDSKLAQLGYFF